MAPQYAPASPEERAQTESEATTAKIEGKKPRFTAGRAHFVDAKAEAEFHALCAEGAFDRA
jgi:hypothetical protein